MSRYLELIERARLVDRAETCSTSGDADYPGSALEVADSSGKDLFHVVVDGTGRRQVLFFASEENYRVPLEMLERIILRAKEFVVAAEDAE